MTTHELASELLAGPDLPVEVDGEEGTEIPISLTETEGRAFYEEDYNYISGEGKGYWTKKEPGKTVERKVILIGYR